LIDIAKSISWPLSEANELAQYFMKVRIREVARTALDSVAAGTENLGVALANHFQKFAQLLWDGQSLSADILAGNGQLLTADILARKREALRLLVEVYSRTISRWLQKRDGMLVDLEAETIALDFLEVKVVSQQELMLNMVAAGRGPLRPRLIASLGNYLRDLDRKNKSSPMQFPTNTDGTSLDIEDKNARDPAKKDPTPAENWSTIRERLLRQLEAIRKIGWQPNNGVAAHRQALLLSERVLFLQWTRDSYAAARKDGLTLDCIALVERAVPWDKEENVACIGTKKTLEGAWKQLAEKLMACNTILKATDFISVIEVGEDTWFQWLKRGRAAVVKEIGLVKARFLFLHWFKRTVSKEQKSCQR
jgi:hypothetical protein